MAAIVYDTIMEQGATFDNTCFPPIALKDSAGNILDLTVWSARAQLRKKYSDSIATAVFTCSSNTTTGTVELNMTAAQTAAIPSGNYYYDMEIYTENDNIVRRIIQGLISVTPEATK